MDVDFLRGLCKEIFYFFFKYFYPRPFRYGLSFNALFTRSFYGDFFLNIPLKLQLQVNIFLRCLFWENVKSFRIFTVFSYNASF